MTAASGAMPARMSEVPPCPTCWEQPERAVADPPGATFGGKLKIPRSGRRAWFEPCGHPLGTLSVWADQIEVTSLGDSGPDPKWRGTDGHGHPHHAVKTGDKVTYPTLLKVRSKEPDWYEDDSEPWFPSWLVCPQCGETVRPGTLGPSSFREFVPGMTHYCIDGMDVSPEQFAWVKDQIDQATRTEDR